MAYEDNSLESVVICAARIGAILLPGNQDDPERDAKDGENLLVAFTQVESWLTSLQSSNGAGHWLVVRGLDAITGLIEAEETYQNLIDRPQNQEVVAAFEPIEPHVRCLGNKCGAAIHALFSEALARAHARDLEAATVIEGTARVTDPAAGGARPLVRTWNAIAESGEAVAADRGAA